MTTLTTLAEAEKRPHEVIELRLSGRDITEIPDRLGEMTRLRRLELSDTSVRRLPEVFGKLFALRALHVLDSPLEAIPESLGWAGDFNFETLHVEGTRVSAIPDSLALANPTELLLARNRISVLPRSLRLMDGLRKLDIRGNPIEELPSFLGQLHYLNDILVGENATGVDLSAQLHPRVRLHIRRLGGSLSPPRMREVRTAVGTRPLPAPLAELVAVSFPAGATGALELSPGEVTEAYVAGVARPFFSIAVDQDQYLYFVDLDDDHPSDPLVYRVDHEGEAGLPVGVRLSERLAAIASVVVVEPSTDPERVVDAILGGSPTLLRACLDAGAAPGAPDEAGVFPLHYAVACGDLEAVRCLLAAGADPDAGLAANLRVERCRFLRGGRRCAVANWPKGFRALHLAAAGWVFDAVGKAYYSAAIVDALLAAGADAGARDGRGKDPLHYAVPSAGPEIIRRLVDAGGDVRQVVDRAKHSPVVAKLLADLGVVSSS